MNDTTTFDLAVIGGGINGAGIAADAAGRGLSVLLVEKGDLAGATSSASSKLIHGGLRYLEHHEFRLVRQSLEEREVLLAAAPHLVRPLRFILPVGPESRSPALIRIGLFIYDHLGKRRSLGRSHGVRLGGEPAGAALQGRYDRAFSYWDCWADDARLVVANCRAAADRGASIRTRTRVTSFAAGDGHWRLQLEEDGGGRQSEARARTLVNAAGPWAGDVRSLDRSANRKGAEAGSRLRLVKGSHIVVPRIGAFPAAFILQNSDGRVVFVLPFEGKFSLIGTTEIPVDRPEGADTPSPEEELYLLDAVNRYLRHPLVRRDIVWGFAGVRPLFDDERAEATAVSRDWRLELDATAGGPALLNVLGGKLTTYRRLAEAALARLAPHLRAMGPPWTARTPLPGGDLGGVEFEQWLADLVRRRSRFPASYLEPLARRHGSLTDDVLGDARDPADLGLHMGGGLTDREVAYLRRREWAMSVEDILWRRTKCGLHMTSPERLRAAEHMVALA